MEKFQEIKSETRRSRKNSAKISSKENYLLWDTIMASTNSF